MAENDLDLGSLLLGLLIGFLIGAPIGWIIAVSVGSGSPVSLGSETILRDASGRIIGVKR